MTDLDVTYENILGDEVISRTEPVEVYLNPHKMMAVLENKYGEEPVLDENGKQLFNPGAIAILAILGYPTWNEHIETATEQDIFLLLGLSLFRNPINEKNGEIFDEKHLFRRIYERMLSFKRANILDGDIAGTIADNVLSVFMRVSSKISYNQITVFADKKVYIFAYLSNHYAVSKTVDELIAVLEDQEDIEKDSEKKTYSSKKNKNFKIQISNSDDQKGKIRVQNQFASELWILTEPLKAVKRTAIDLADGTPIAAINRMKESCAFGPAPITKSVYLKKVRQLEKSLMKSIEKESEEQWQKEFDAINKRDDN